LFATGPLGGGLLAASTPDFLHDLRRLLDQQLRMIEVHGVAVVQKAPDIDTLNTFDAVVFATGGVSNPVALDGWNGEVRDAEELLREEGRISGSVAVLGNGLWGARVALHFARAGAEVTIVGTGDDLLGDAPPTELMTYPSALQEAGVRVLRGESVTTAEGFFVSAPDALPLADDALVVNATGQRGPSPSELSPGLEEAGVDVFVVGDAAGPGTLHDAIHTAFFSARLI
jgi:pyruvate/2-oxoglutarate dehydrogenase complex dihydrolipoamide dehydrogenase (E3) component